MRWIGTVGRVQTACAALAAMAMLAANAFGEPASVPDGAPTAVARHTRPHLPRPLPAKLAARIRRVFALQAAGDIAEAVRMTSRLPLDTPLRRAMFGYILADRYLGRFTETPANALAAWLKDYGDLADAPAVRSLLARRGGAPDAFAAPGTFRRDPHLDAAIAAAARSAEPQAALRIVERRRIDAVYASELLGEAARILFTRNKDQAAYDIGAAAAARCRREPRCGSVALPAYMAGLAAWRLGRWNDARRMFVTAWQARWAHAPLRAAAAFWTARTWLAAGAVDNYFLWMRRAGAEAGTFYGILARHTLGLDVSGGADDDVLTQANADAVAATPEGLRAFALLQVGQKQRAAAELWSLWEDESEPALDRSIMLVARRAGIDDLAGKIASALRTEERPLCSRLRPRGGFTVDPPMVYALARAESDFDASLVSPAGARGLLQIMPKTALFIAKSDAGLNNPAVNLAVGQRYVAWLATADPVSGDLIRLLGSYNDGPAGFASVSSAIVDWADPLLFIEAIPVRETRTFVQRVLTYTWLYAARLALPAPSLDELAAGGRPRYHAPRPTETAASALD